MKLSEFLLLLGVITGIPIIFAERVYGMGSAFVDFGIISLISLILSVFFYFKEKSVNCVENKQGEKRE